MKLYPIHFPGTQMPCVELPEGSALALNLTAVNSPLLFGCRAGLCGTCLVELIPLDAGEVTPPTSEEREALDIYAPGQPRARLACQVRVTAAMSVRRIV